KEILQKHGFTFKKSLGQNFLIDANIIHKVLDRADINEDTAVIEVGPGIGSLTEQIAKRAGKVVAYEIDQRLIPVLNDTLGPYHIATPILMNFLMQNLPVDRYYVMMQKEVGERISADPGTKAYGSLSIAIDYYTDAKTVQNVPKAVFMPAPNVDSIIVEMKARKEPKVAVEDEEKFFRLTRGAFVQRRKTILNNYLSLFEDGKAHKLEINELLNDAEIEPRRRGESLSIEDFAAIYRKLENFPTLKFV